MLEPCVMDIKMGQRTWDPLAPPTKRDSEDAKYKQCKETVGFCVPGFQVYQISSGNFLKYGRDYGKKLNQNTVKDGEIVHFELEMLNNFKFAALKLFLNADSGLNRQLITSILTSLWAIQKFMRTQTVFKIFSSSILIVYDARRLKQILESQKRNSCKLLDPHNVSNSPTGDSPKGSKGDLRPGSNRNSGSFEGSKESLSDGSKTPKAVYKQLQRSHSSTNNYEQVWRFWIESFSDFDFNFPLGHAKHQK